MARVDYRRVKKDEHKRLVKDLSEAFVLLRDRKHIEAFLTQFLTPSEVVMIGRRWQIALRLLEGQTYLEIRQKLGVGFQTIERVDRWLYTSLDNYDRITKRQRKRLQAKGDREQQLQLTDGKATGTFSELRQRHSGPFLLVSLLIGTLKAKRSSSRKNG